MNRHGSALLGALWLSVLLAAATAAVLGAARLGTATTANRLALGRSAWAAAACLAVAQTRFAEAGELPPTLEYELPDGAACRAELEDPGADIHLNFAGAEVLGAVLGRPELAEALLDWRDADDLPRPTGAERGWYDSAGASSPRNGPLASVEELAFVRGFDDSVLARVRPFVTVRGSGRVSLNHAPAPVLAALPGFGPEVIEVILARRARGGRWAGFEEVYHATGPGAREVLGARYQELAGLVEAEAGRLVLHLTAKVLGASPVYRLDVTVAPAGSRLAIVTREVR